VDLQLPDLSGVLHSLPGILGGGAGLKVLQFMFRASPDLKVCRTRVIREGRGFPWNRQVAIHKLKDGRLQVTPIYGRR
jgi:hypothetical protein